LGPPIATPVSGTHSRYTDPPAFPPVCGLLKGRCHGHSPNTFRASHGTRLTMYTRKHSN
jgi:hypothetical protein